MELTEGQKRYRKYKDKILAYYKSHRDNVKNRNYYLFGGNRAKVLERDGYKCVKCGMTMEEHKKKWNRELTIDHIDGNGLGKANSATYYGLMFLKS